MSKVYLGTHDFAGATVTGLPSPTLTYQTVQGTTDINTSSATFVDMTDMSITVASAGTYLILFSATGSGDETSSGSTSGGQYQVLHGATSLAYSAHSHSLTGTTQGGIQAGCSIVVVRAGVSASDVIKVQWRRGTGDTAYNRPATVYDHRTLTIVKLA